MNKWTIADLPEKTRLDVFLAKELALPRHQIQKLIKAGQISINSKATDSPHHWLKAGMIIQLLTPKKPTAKKVDIKVNILKETKDYLVVNKPAGLTVHPAPGINEITLVDWLKKNYPKVTKIGEEKNRPGIVHRLDKPVSGCLVVALSQKMFIHLKQQFMSRLVKKEYLALVQGDMKEDEGVINVPIGRSKEGHFAAHTQNGLDDREAVTYWKVKERYLHATLLQLTPATGRTHQLRVHCKAIGHAIIGDEVYKNRKTLYKFPPLNRVFLHAYKLSFKDLEDNQISITCTLPKELSDYLKLLKKV